MDACVVCKRRELEAEIERLTKENRDLRSMVAQYELPVIPESECCMNLTPEECATVPSRHCDNFNEPNAGGKVEDGSG